MGDPQIHSQGRALGFSPNLAPEQRARVEKDGSYVLEVPYSHDRELVMEIFKYGPDVEVLGPLGLRRRVAEAAREVAERYG